MIATYIEYVDYIHTYIRGSELKKGAEKDVVNPSKYTQGKSGRVKVEPVSCLLSIYVV